MLKRKQPSGTVIMQKSRVRYNVQEQEKPKAILEATWWPARSDGFHYMEDLDIDIETELKLDKRKLFYARYIEPQNIIRSLRGKPTHVRERLEPQLLREHQKVVEQLMIYVEDMRKNAKFYKRKKKQLITGNQKLGSDLSITHYGEREVFVTHAKNMHLLYRNKMSDKQDLSDREFDEVANEWYKTHFLWSPHWNEHQEEYHELGNQKYKNNFPYPDREDVLDIMTLDEEPEVLSNGGSTVVMMPPDDEDEEILRPTKRRRLQRDLEESESQYMFMKLCDKNTDVVIPMVESKNILKELQTPPALNTVKHVQIRENVCIPVYGVLDALGRHVSAFTRADTSLMFNNKEHSMRGWISTYKKKYKFPRECSYINIPEELIQTCMKHSFQGKSEEFVRKTSLYPFALVELKGTHLLKIKK